MLQDIINDKKTFLP
jgi:hypothetical protein